MKYVYCGLRQQLVFQYMMVNNVLLYLGSSLPDLCNGEMAKFIYGVSILRTLSQILHWMILLRGPKVAVITT